MVIGFSEITLEQRGLLADLLHVSYATLLADESGCWSGLAKEQADFDYEVFEDFSTMSKCVFLTTRENEVVGFASFDPRSWPHHGVVGHNCILPAYRGEGIGRRQIEEVLSRLRRMGMERAVVSTNEHPFFLPARRNYESCGFIEFRSFAGGPDPRYAMIEYVKDLPIII